MAHTRLGFPPDDIRNSHGPRRRYKGGMVLPSGSPRAQNSNTKRAKRTWERNGVKTSLPNDMRRGWK